MFLFSMILACATSGPEPEGIDFDTEIVPILTKAGCNAASCHGSANGRGGFRLSLFGGDADWDYRSIVREVGGRRVNLADPSLSLVMLKPTGEADHEGGVRLDLAAPDTERLHDWIDQGAPRLQLRKLTRLNVQPAHVRLPDVPAQTKITVVAHFDDGSQVDVSHSAVYWADDEGAVEISPNGEVTVSRRGRFHVLVRFLSVVKAIPITVPLPGEVASDRSPPTTIAETRDRIDDAVNRTLVQLNLDVAPPAADHQLHRRIRLDLTGRLPTVDQAQEFAASDNPAKYEQLVEELLESDEFVEYWTFQLAAMLRVRSPPREDNVSAAIHQWIRSKIEERRPLTELASEMITATGDSHQDGAAATYRLTADARSHAEYISEVFMGVRLRCANCHNHPLDRWIQDDYHGLAAVFARVGRGRNIRPLRAGDVIHPATGKPAAPKVPGGPFLAADGDPRQELANWLVDPSNGYFSQVMVNRMWKSMMGRGLVEPVDDMRATNPATHPELLAALATEFAEGGFRIRPLLREICMSAAYRRANRTGSDQHNLDYLSHHGVRGLAAEVLLDAICDVTGVAEEFPGISDSTRAVELQNPTVQSSALEILGRCDRTGSCEQQGPSVAPGLATILHLINGPLLNEKIGSESGRLQHLLQSHSEPMEIVNEFYWAALSRPPTQKEKDYWSAQLAPSDDPIEKRRVLEDFVWSLLNCREFQSNH